MRAEEFGICPVCKVIYVEIHRGNRWGPVVRKCPRVKTHNYSTYVNHGCRCRLCSAANTAQQQGRRARKAELILANPELAPHGTWRTYMNWSCKCEKCRRAHARRAKKIRAS